MQYVIITSALGRMHGYIRHGEAMKFQLLLQANEYVNELWYLVSTRVTTHAQPRWNLVLRRTGHGLLSPVTDEVTLDGTAF